MLKAHSAVSFQDPLHQQMAQQVEHCYQVAESKLGKRFARPEIAFTLRGKSAGTAHLQLNKLRFNPKLLNDNQQAFLDDVIPHEICHLLAFQLYGRVKPHGREWQSLMQSLYGRVPRTTHSFDTRAVEGKTFEYHCQCGPIKLSIRRHNKVVRGETQYRCRRCGHQLSTKVGEHLRK
ncbi:SprT family zinc-dependent metalloprotease [Shewanella sp. Isolate13]|uniref:SprT family zinc-dependent metalloprotease n=1 Tax=Shewanella sp. Isolate13 TaxID=2908531 RepID=UPI001EFDC892|nr:SprT family zinc-dependent metalloprotease [Shewanella sp. Isolate13]MCG9728317.1 SprT family zinc-dependent metalloprotease [Shewanella sp. Isolate13]